MYSGGEENITPVNKRDFLYIFHYGYSTVLFFTILFVNYFTEIPKGLQITLTAIAIIIFGFFIVRYLENGLLFQLALVCLALLILLNPLILLIYYFPYSNGFLYFYCYYNVGFGF